MAQLNDLLVLGNSNLLGDVTSFGTIKATTLTYSPDSKLLSLDDGTAIVLRRNASDAESLRILTEANNGTIDNINKTAQSVLNFNLKYNSGSNVSTVIFRGDSQGSHITLKGSNPLLGFADAAGTIAGYLQYVDASTDYFALGKNATYGLQIDVSGNVSIPANTNLTPRTTNSTTPSGSLGTSSQTWATGYIKNLHIYGSASATMTAASTNPKITFSENGTQPVHLIYTDYDTYRGPAGLKVIGDTSQTSSPAWFEVEGDIYAGNKFIQTKTESSATHTLSMDCYSINFNSTSTGGWARAIKWQNNGSVKSQLGGFGSGDTMTYLFYGKEYNDTNFRVYNDTGKIAIRNNTTKPAAGVDLPVLNVQYQNSGSGTYYDTDIISVVGVGESSTTVNNAFVRVGSTSGNLALTAGESAKTFIAKKADSTSTATYVDGWINTESMYMITDGQIRMYVGCHNSDGSGTNIANFTNTGITFNHTLTFANSTATNNKITTASNSALYIAPTSTLYLDSGSGSSVIFRQGGTEAGRFATDGTFYVVSAARPDTNGGATLGTSSYYWGNTYTGTIYQAAGSSIEGLYSSTNYTLLKNHNNGNVTVNAASKTLYLGYMNTTGIQFGASGAWANMTSSKTTFYHSICIQGASGNWNEKQIGVYYGSSANTSQFYLWGNTSSATRGIYDSVLGYVISTDSNLAYLHGTVVAKSAHSYGTEAQRKAITSPKTGQVFFQLL